MQQVRIITKEDQANKNFKGTIYEDTNVSIKFDEQIVSIWNGVYWEETPFKEIFCIATWDE